MAELKRVGIYIRVSSDRQAKTGDSLREQEETLTDYVNNNEDMIIHSTYIDDGISGQKIERDEFARLIEDVKEGSVNLIIFTKLDRWFRSLRHYLNTQAILDKHNVAWDAVSQPYFDTTTAYGRANVANSMTYAELEAQMGSERILAVFDNKVKNGEVISGNTPLGYSIENKKLVINEDSEKVRKIFEHYEKTNNLNDTLRFMAYELEIVRSPAALRAMLKNKKYVGIFRTNLNYCQPIIDQLAFDNVQRLLGLNIKSNTKYDYIFSGLIVCDNCNHAMNSSHKHYYSSKRKDGSRIKYPKKARYVCRYANEIPKCKNTKEFKETIVENYLLDNIKPIIEEYLNSSEIENKKMRTNNSKVNSINKKIERLKAAYLNEIIDINEYKKDRAELIAQSENITIPKKEKSKDNNKLLKEALDLNFEKVYTESSVKEKRRIWRSIIKEIRVDYDKNIKIKFL